MKMTRGEFLQWEHKAITLLGMSGVGKTTLANKLPKTNWFHYSGDYRIGTRYLAEPIVDNVKRAAMQVPFLRGLLCSDSIYIASNITVHNLEPLSTFLGKVGDPSRGGLTCEEFLARQRLHHDAEIRAMRDVVEFAGKARDIYGYDHFVNDAGGSVCELDDPADDRAARRPHDDRVHPAPARTWSRSSSAARRATRSRSTTGSPSFADRSPRTSRRKVSTRPTTSSRTGSCAGSSPASSNAGGPCTKASPPPTAIPSPPPTPRRCATSGTSSTWSPAPSPSPPPTTVEAGAVA